MNAADNGIIAAKKIIINFTAETVWHSLQACFWQNRCPRTACFAVRHRLWDLSLEMPADEKARSGLMLAGGINRKLEAFW